VTQRALFEDGVLVSEHGSYLTETPLPTRAATLYQPWAWLVAHGHKPLENRPKGFWKLDFRGWFWIHAAKLSAEEARLVRAGEATDEWLSAHELAMENGFAGLPALDDPRMHFGAIIGRARVAGVLPVPKLPDGWRMEGKYGFVVADPKPLREPVPCRGFQGFWTVPDDILAKLKERL
jgi:hypothetical protein